MLAETAKDVAVAIEQAEAVWADFVEQPRGEVTVTVFPTVGQMLLPGALDRVAEVAGLTVICSDQDPLLPDFADLTPDHDIVVADAPGVLPRLARAQPRHHRAHARAARHRAARGPPARRPAPSSLPPT